MPPKKRKAASQATASTAGTKAKQTKKKDQKSVSKVPVIPLDEGYGEGAGQVIVDNDQTVWDATLNQTQVGQNANKFYRLQVIKQGRTHYAHFRWGRVGVFGQVTTTPYKTADEAKKAFEKKFKEKSGVKWEDRLTGVPKKNGYTFIERNYESDGEDDSAAVKTEENEDEDGDPPKPIESKLPIQTQRLMELIFNENHFNAVLESIGYNQDKLPLGKLSENTVKHGFEHLKELASLIKHPSLAQNKYGIPQQEALEDFTNKYYSTIPHAFGFKKPPIIKDYDILQKEVAMLDTLTDMGVAKQIMKTTEGKHKDTTVVSRLDQHFSQLKLTEATPLDPKSKEYQSLKNYLINTAGHTHSMRFRLQDIFRIEREGEKQRFEKSDYAKRDDKNRRLLWHGSRTTNYGGILSQGLRIAPPEAPVNGYAFGKGVYLADVSTKSANYCIPSLSGDQGLLLLCEAELGNPMYELLTGDSRAQELSVKNGSIATYGVGRTAPTAWVDAGDVIHESLRGVKLPDPKKAPEDQKLHPSAYLQYNEYICYDVAQIRLRYLLRWST